MRLSPSPAAQFQATKTRAVLGVQLFSQDDAISRVKHLPGRHQPVSARTIEPLVLADEIKLLRPFTGYLCLAGHHRTTVRIPELHLTRYHPAFIPRAADEPPAPPAAQLSEPEIAAQIIACAARSTEL